MSIIHSSPDAENSGAANPGGNGSALPQIPKPSWKPFLDSYKDLRALTFDTVEGVDAAIDLLWTDDLRELPHDLAGGDTVIVPAEAVPYFQRAGLIFTETDVLSPADLSEEELNQLRREQGPY